MKLLEKPAFSFLISAFFSYSNLWYHKTTMGLTVYGSQNMKLLSSAVLLVALFHANALAQDFTSEENKKHYDSIKKLILKRKVDTALIELDKAVGSASGETADLMMLETLRVKIAQQMAIARQHEDAISEFKKCATYLKDHLENPVAQTHCVAAYRGLNNLARQKQEAARVEEWVVDSFKKLIKLDKGKNVTTTSANAAKLASSFAQVPNLDDERKKEVVKLVDGQIRRLKSKYNSRPDEMTALALSSYYGAAAEFEIKDLEKFEQISLKREKFLAKAMTKFNESFPLVFELTQATTRRISRIKNDDPNAALETMENVLEILERAEESLGSRVISQIQTIERFGASLEK